MKKLLLLACLCFALAPQSLRAQNDNSQGQNDDSQGQHPSKGAPEMPGIAFGVAAVIGVAGYLVLRRRHNCQN
jgi:hypothetical protein